MKNLIFISNLSQGGSQRICSTLLKYGISNDVLLLSDKGRAFSLPEHINVHSLKAPSTIKSLLPLFKFIKNRKPDSILVFNHQLALCLLIIRFIFRCNYRIIARNISTLSRKFEEETSVYRRHLVYPLIKAFYGKVDVIVSQSKGMETDLKEFLSVKTAEFIQIYNPIIHCQETLLKRTLQKERRGFLFAGRLESVKGVTFLLESYLLYVFQSNEQDIEAEPLYIYGSGSLKSNIEQFIYLHELEKYIFISDFSSDFLLKSYEVKYFLLTSLYEGFPNAMAESIASGIPAISLDIKSGPSEILIDGVNGFLVENHNKENFVKCMLKKDYFDPQSVAKTMMKFELNEILTQYQRVIR